MIAADLRREPVARQVFFAKYQERLRARDVKGFRAKAQLLRDSCHPFQRMFVDDPAKRIVALTAGRGGKSTGGMVRQMVKCLEIPRCRCVYIAKSKPQAEELIWGKIKRAWANLGVKPMYSEQKLKCTLRENGSFIRLVGADDLREIDKLRGQPFHDALIDEASTHRDELLIYLVDDVLGVRLGDFRGTLELTGTPGLVKAGKFWELTMPQSQLSRPYKERDNFTGWKGWSFHGWSVPDAAPYVQEIQNAYDEGLETKEREGWSDTHPTWMREYLGVWAEDDTLMVFRYRAVVDEELQALVPAAAGRAIGSLWNRWSPEKDELGIAILPEPRGEYHYVIGFDLGGGKASGTGGGVKRRVEERAMGHRAAKKGGDPTAIEILAWDDQNPDKMLWHVYEFHSRERLYARLIAQLLLGPGLDTDKPEGIFGVIGWPDGMVADIGSIGGMVLEELANVYGLAIEPADKSSRHSAVEGWNGDLLDGRLFVMEGSVLESQQIQLQWEIDPFGFQAKNKRQRDDASDAGIYARSLAYHLLAEERPAAPPRQSRFELVGKEREPKPKRGPFDGMVTPGITYYDDEGWA